MTESNEGCRTWRPKPLAYDPASTWISFADPADHPDREAGGDYAELIAMDGAELREAEDRDRYGRLFAASPAMFAVLRDVEWEGNVLGTVCPVCVRHRTLGHSPDCRLVAVLRDAGGEENHR